MAAYAALLSLIRIIEKLHLHRHPPPISLHQKQIESLTERITFLEEFLEAYNPLLGYSAEADPLETRIADAAYAAEDVIESNIVDRITNENMSSDGLYEGLEKVIQDMASIQKEAMEIRDTMGLQLQHHTNSTPAHQESLRSTSIAHNSSSMVGVDDVLLQIKDNLTSHSRHLEIIPIVGMGGSGKTTLASNIYQDPLIHHHFHVYAWATISQEYSIRGIFSQILGKLQNREVDQHLSEGDLGNMLHKYLFGRKYLIIMDDIWNIEAWENVRRFFPDTKNGSRIVITTRLSNLASEITDSNRLETSLLDENNSWKLLAKIVFGENGCPLELEEIGKKIATSCKGLPLSIVVVGGFLAKSKHTREFWEYIEENLNSIVNSVEDESCLKILHMSYKQLPLYLKPCFLYMGVFREDEEICVSKLTRLWVAEGFLKPIKGKSLEEIAKEYLKDLTDRNLILIWKKGISGSITKCKIHDMLREICLREAEKEMFYVVARQYGPHQGVTITQRRIVISDTSKKEDIDALQSVSLARSLIWDRKENPPLLNLRLLRIFETSWGTTTVENMCHLVNLRYLGRMYVDDDRSLSTLNRLWNLETLYVFGSVFLAAIWCMPHIRHVVCPELEGCLPDPPSGSQNDIVLENLHTIKGIRDLKLSDEAVKRIPNVKKLGITFEELDGWSCIDNVVRLQKLVSLDCDFRKKMYDSGQSLNFPRSLKKLKLRVEHYDCWDYILEKIGSLPLLEKLTLQGGCFEGGKWETAEGQFQSLKYLKLFWCDNLKQWTMESSHYPRLERLVTVLMELEEIPLQVAEIPTLGLIELIFCSESATISARRIVEEQEESNGEAAIQVLICFGKNNEAVESLATHPNIHVEIKQCFSEWSFKLKV